MFCVGWVILDQDGQAVSKVFDNHDEALEFKKGMDLKFLNTHKIILKEITNETNEQNLG